MTSDHHAAPPAAAWLRNAQIALYALMSLTSLGGLGYVFYSAFTGHTAGALVGAVIAIGGIALGSVALAVVRFCDGMLERTRQIELSRSRVEARLEALECALEAQSTAVDLSRMAPPDPQHLVAASLGREVFPRLVESAAPDPSEDPTADEHAADELSLGEHLAQQRFPDEHAPELSPAEPAKLRAPGGDELQWQLAYQNGDVPACRQSLDRLRGSLAPARIAHMEQSLRDMSHAKYMHLREDFARMVRLHQYEAALITGEEIAKLFPDTSTAREFEALRPHLNRLAKEQEGADQASAI